MKKGYLFIIFATFFFSSMETALKLASGSFNPVQLTFLRFLIGSLVLLPPALRELKRKGTALNARDFAFLAGTGFLCVVVSMILYQMAIVYSPASLVAVLFSCNPVFAVLFAHFLLGEKIYRHTVLSVVICTIGILVIINPLHMAGGAVGIVLTICSALTFALYNIVGRTRSSRYGGTALTCFSFLFGCAEMLALIGVSHIAPAAALMNRIGLPAFADIPVLSGIAPGSVPGLLYVGVFVTGLGYAFYFLAMEETSAATASLVFDIKPVLAPLLALALLGEPITGTMAAGILLILAGSLFSFIPGIRMRRNEGRNGGNPEQEDGELETEPEEP